MRLQARLEPHEIKKSRPDFIGRDFISFAEEEGFEPGLPVI
jgi:hypothetical protein